MLGVSPEPGLCACSRLEPAMQIGARSPSLHVAKPPLSMCLAGADEQMIQPLSRVSRMTHTSHGISASLTVSQSSTGFPTTAPYHYTNRPGEHDCMTGSISQTADIPEEIAHNLESAHNASHEFYFSSIAEEYLVRFSRLLDNGSAA
jgi:hypothetical protein